MMDQKDMTMTWEETMRQEILSSMDEAAKEDRQRFFAVADAMTFQPKYQEKREELEAVKQQWRDMTALAQYPQIQWPLELPDWFPVVHFASRWNPDHLERKWEERKREYELRDLEQSR